MCGIVGFIEYSLHHRGPDDHGIEYLQKDSIQIALGHKRSIFNHTNLRT